MFACNAPYTATDDYAKRWAIETLFGCFKSHVFCLEVTHLQDSERLSKLIALLTLALCWCFSSGLWQSFCNPLKPKKHGHFPKSIFRLGFDFLRHFIRSDTLSVRSNTLFLRGHLCKMF